MIRVQKATMLFYSCCFTSLSIDNLIVKFRIWIFGPGTDPMSLVYITTHCVLVLVGVHILKNKNSQRLCHLRLEPDEIWQDCFSSKYTSIHEVGFWYDLILSRWRPWCPPAACSIRWLPHVRQLPASMLSVMRLLACCVCYSSWSIVHSYLFYHNCVVISWCQCVMQEWQWA